MCLKDLYRISEFAADEGSFSAAISFNPEHDIFNGHFPAQPVVPGVCLIHIVKEITSRISGEKMQLQKGINTKFLQLIDPRKSPGLSIQGMFSSTETGEMRITATISGEETTFFKFKGIFS